MKVSQCPELGLRGLGVAGGKNVASELGPWVLSPEPPPPHLYRQPLQRVPGQEVLGAVPPAPRSEAGEGFLVLHSGGVCGSFLSRLKAPVPARGAGTGLPPWDRARALLGWPAMHSGGRLNGLA